MKRCPSCNRTYPNDAQKFCTKDGTSLVHEPTAGLQTPGETVRFDSSELNATRIDDEVTKVISRELPPEPAEFDPYKTVLAKSRESSADLSRTTGGLTPSQTSEAGMSGTLPGSDRPPSDSQQLPPSSSSGPISPPSSGPISPPSSGPIGTPSRPLPSGDVGMETIASITPRAAPVTHIPAPPPAAAHPSAHVPTVAQPHKKSKLPLVLGILAVLFFLGIGAVGAAYWFVVRPMLESRRTIVEPTPTPAATPVVRTTPQPTPDVTKEIPAYSPPANAVQFVNSKDNLDGKLAEHYVDFSFYYPQHWEKDASAGGPGASNFAKVERRLPPDFTQENFAVGWYASAGSEEGDRATFPSLAANLSSQFAKGFAEYRKVSEGPSKAGPYDGYEFRFESASRNTEKGDIKIWGRVIFVPPVDGGKNGVTLLMLATSLAEELKSVNDVGVKGDLPMMLESFRFGK
jgi:hypothetical protein